jgi:hypothetical protein
MSCQTLKINNIELPTLPNIYNENGDCKIIFNEELDIVSIPIDLWINFVEYFVDVETYKDLIEKK